MARYDDMGHRDPDFTGGFFPGGTGAPGSGGRPSVPVPAPGATYAAGTEGPAAAALPEGTVMVSNVFGGPSVTAVVRPADTQVPSQSELYGGRELISGVDLSGGTTAGQYNQGAYASSHIIPEPQPDNPAAEGHPNAQVYSQAYGRP